MSNKVEGEQRAQLSLAHHARSGVNGGACTHEPQTRKNEAIPSKGVRHFRDVMDSPEGTMLAQTVGLVKSLMPRTD